jgi:hypothetical protein
VVNRLPSACSAADEARRDRSLSRLDRNTSELSDALDLVHGIPRVGSGRGSKFFVYSNSVGSIWVLPADGRDRQASLALYAPQKILGRILRLAMRFGALSRTRIELESKSLHRLGREIATVLGEPSVTLAFYIGTPSAYRKTTACAIGDSGDVVGFFKLASLGPSKLLVRNERNVLVELSCADELQGRVPDVAGAFDWMGADVLVLTPGPRGRGPGRLGPPHVEFLSRLHRATSTPGRLVDSPSWSHAVETIERLESRIPQIWADRYTAALDRLSSGLGRRTIPLSRAHRDFTPWNTTIGQNGLFAFDWEMSRDGLPPLYDVFHFASASAALLGRPFDIPSVTGDLLSRLWPDGSGMTDELRLAYLTDVSVHYTEARVEHPTEGCDVMWNWQGQELDRVLATG